MNEKPVIVIVKQLPERLVAGLAHRFYRQIEALLRSQKTRVVFDFSNARQLDSQGISMLLHCTEEILKRNGNVKLAGVSSEIGVMLELTNVDTLFEMFDTVADAVESYSHRSVVSSPPLGFAENEVSDDTYNSDPEIAA